MSFFETAREPLVVPQLVVGEAAYLVGRIAGAAVEVRLPVDASVIATAERLGVPTIATLDLRHFTVVRPNHVDAFLLVP